MFETHRTVRMLGLSLLVSIAAASTSRAEFPALTRMSGTADYGIGHADLVARKQLALAVSLGLAAGLQGRPLSVGSTQGVGRASGEKLYGRLSVFADGLWDHQRHLDPAEFPLRLGAGVDLPELRSSVRAGAGLGSREDRGTEIAVESHLGRLPTPFKTANLQTPVYAWLRVRTAEGDPDAVMQPALGLGVPHLPVLANRLTFMLSAQSTVAEGRLPATFAMLQGRFLGATRHVGGGSGLGALPGGGLQHRPDPRTTRIFGFAAWACPLDSRSPARLSLQVGYKFLDP